MRARNPESSNGVFMSTSDRSISTFFNALPAFVFFAVCLGSGLRGREYYWTAYLGALIVLMSGSLLFGFRLPTLFRRLGIRKPWMWILAQGLLTWALALFTLGVLNMTPLCVGQDNGDGNNNLGMCMGYTILVSMVYTPIFLGMQTVSALIGHWVLSLKMKLETQS